MSMDITDVEAERALRWMATTDAQFADARVMVLRCEYMADVAESMAFKHETGTVEDRKRAAKAAPDVAKAKENYFVAVRGYEVLRAQRKRAELTLELWRSVNSNRRHGQVG